MKTLNAALFTFVTLVAPVAADPCLFLRQDTSEGKFPYQSVGLIDRLADGSSIEGYAFGISDKREGEVDEYRAGAILPIVRGRVTLRVGGYLSYFPGKDEVFILPWVDGTVSLPAKGTFRWCLGGHLPLNGGNATIFSNEMAATWKMTQKTSIGVAGTFFQRGSKPCPFRVGLKTETKVSRSMVHLRYLPPLRRAPSQIRLQTLTPF